MTWLTLALWAAGGLCVFGLAAKLLSIWSKTQLGVPQDEDDKFA
jgi:hypothetical protein